MEVTSSLPLGVITAVEGGTDVVAIVVSSGEGVVCIVVSRTISLK